MIAVGVVVAVGVLVATFRTAGPAAPDDDRIEPATPEPNDDGDLVGASTGLDRGGRR